MEGVCNFREGVPSASPKGWGLVQPNVSILKILRILWRIQKWMKNTKKDFDPDPTSGLDLG